MAIRYINPGYASLLDSSSLVTVSSDSTYSKTGSSFLCGGYSSTTHTADKLAKVTFTDSMLANVEDFWFSVDFYLKHPLAEDFNIVFDFDTYFFWVGLYFRDDVFDDVYVGQIHRGLKFEGDARTLLINSYLYNQINNLRVHLTRSNGILSISLNGCEFQEEKNQKYLGEPMPTFYIRPRYASDVAYISNIIISDEPILYGDLAVKVPASATYTDWTAGQDGIYIADAANQTLMQSPDVSNLISTYGASAKVTGVMLHAKPAYRTGEGLTMIQSQYQNGDTLTAGDAPITLSNSTLGSAFDGFTFDKLTLQNFKDMQFGWKALEAGD